MSDPTMSHYRRAQDAFDAAVAAVPATAWDAASPCTGWTVRDVAGHVVWGQQQMQHWATGEPFTDMRGAPGAAHPGEMAGADPVTAWRTARAACVERLTPEGLARTISLPGLGVQPLGAIVELLTTDHLAHTWDVAHAAGVDTTLDADLVTASFSWARDHVARVPGLFGPELAPPGDADEQTRWLAFLGRAAWLPVAA